jgi:hypothetical protein
MLLQWKSIAYSPFFTCKSQGSMPYCGCKNPATETEVKTRSEEIAADVSALLRARSPLLWIVTREEARVEQYLFEAAAKAGYQSLTWDVGSGLQTPAGQKAQGGSNDLGEMLALIAGKVADNPYAQTPTRTTWILRDAAIWLDGLVGAQPTRLLRNLARSLPAVEAKKSQAIIVLTTSAKVPDDLAGHATVIEWPLPDRNEIAGILDACIAGLPEDIKASAAPNGTRDAAIDAAVGLTGEEAQGCYAKSLVQLKRIDPVMVAAEKKRVIARKRMNGSTATWETGDGHGLVLHRVRRPQDRRRRRRRALRRPGSVPGRRTSQGAAQLPYVGRRYNDPRQHLRGRARKGRPVRRAATRTLRVGVGMGLPPARRGR